MVRITFLHLALLMKLVSSYVDVPCQWKSKTGANFDLRPLMVKDETKKVYELKDGDIPCTPEKEPNYNYVFNFCGDVTTASFPKSVCSDIQMGAAIQYIDRSDGYKECNVIGHYDPERDDTSYTLLDPQDPSKGVAITYQYGQKCPSGKLRSATINVQCANVKYVEDSANEPAECAYEVTMRSMYGCPTECPITSAGLCNNHGHCAYDPKARTSHCYCNKGYGGASCLKSSSSNSDGESSGSAVYSFQVALMVILLLAAMVLTGFVGYLGYRITEFRKEQSDSFASNYAAPGDGTEMVNRPF